MSLAGRLCQADTDMDPVHGEPEERHIALEIFMAAVWRALFGAHTTAQVKAFFDIQAGQEETDFDALVARVTAYPAGASRNLAAHQIREILIIWETGNAGINGYTTVDQVWAHLMAI